GTAVDLAFVNFRAEFIDGTFGTIKGNQLTWSTTDGNGISFTGGKMTVANKGLFTVTAQKDSASITMQVVAKAPSDTDYVLYEENFDTLANGAMPQGWTRKQGTTAAKASVQNNAFEIDALTGSDNPTRVLLPDYLAAFGDYKVEADVTFVQVNNNSRWSSIMLRVQNQDFPYYQFCVRQNAAAANGVEWSHRTTKPIPDDWEVFETNSYGSAALALNTANKYTAVAQGNRVQFSLNNTLLFDTDGASAYSKGHIGFQANGSKIRLDNVRVTLVKSLQHDQGYVKAVTGTPVDLASISFTSEGTSDIIKGDQVQWSTAAGNGISFADGKMTVTNKGVYPISAKKDGATVTIQVVAKNPSDTEYVLYEEDFDGLANGTMPKGWTRKQGTTVAKASVQNKVFEIDALTAPDNPTRVLLPDYLGDFGDYKIEADLTIIQANNDARWDSIMFRIQNNDLPYYHMAVRKDAPLANGVEFSQRNADNSWTVNETGSFSEKIQSSKMYRYTVKAHGNRLQILINDELLIDTDGAYAFTKGKIGVQADGNKMRMDNVRVTLQDELPPLPADLFVRVTEPETKIALAPTVVTELESVEQLAELTDSQFNKLPSTVFLHVNKDLTVTNSSGQTEIGSLASVLATINNRMIPSFYVKDEQTVDALVAYLKNVRIEDANIVSNNGELVKRAREAYTIIRGIVDFTANTDWSAEKLLEIRGETNISQAKVILLPQNAASKDSITFLQKLGMTVWTKEQAVAGEKNLAIHTLITAGTNGIITDSPLQAIDALKLYSNKTTLIRKPFIVGHRGMPSIAPENTIEGNRLAIEAGADHFETDVYLTKDGVPIIFHDATLQRTTNGTGYIEDFTLAELKLLNANKQFPTAFPNVKIPTLEEQIDLARATDTVIQTEIKSTNPLVIDAIVELVKRKKAQDLITVISFDTNQIKRMNELMPEITTELVTGTGISKTWDVNRAVRQTLLAIQPLNAVFNANYSILSQEFMEAAKHRGQVIAPWTFNNRDDLIRFYMYGTWGLTTDYAHWASDWTASIKPNQEQYTLDEKQSVDVFAEIETYKGDVIKGIAPVIVLLDGEDIVEVKGNKVTGKQPGTAHALLRYTTTINASNQYDIYTQPITIVIEEETATEPGETEPSFDTNNDGRESVADLAIISANYGATSSDSGWQSIKVADLNQDNVIDELDIELMMGQLFASSR
ncbi:MAG TPA: DUF1080 domain-containing protein, partial [Candidatus Paenibacillus intestinavium]|nr:DUF1080 domain-containing protein [Candidatus Paenibacillus intestinavium]